MIAPVNAMMSGLDRRRIGPFTVLCRIAVLGPSFTTGKEDAPTYRSMSAPFHGAPAHAAPPGQLFLLLFNLHFAFCNSQFVIKNTQKRDGLGFSIKSGAMATFAWPYSWSACTSHMPTTSLSIVPRPSLACPSFSPCSLSCRKSLRPFMGVARRRRY
jgi:hypothetical protein